MTTPNEDAGAVDPREDDDATPSQPLYGEPEQPDPQYGQPGDEPGAG